MFTTSGEITIDYPINEVFAFIADNENDPQWCVPVVETPRIAGSAPGTRHQEQTTYELKGLLAPLQDMMISQYKECMKSNGGG